MANYYRFKKPSSWTGQGQVRVAGGDIALDNKWLTNARARIDGDQVMVEFDHRNWKYARWLRVQWAVPGKRGREQIKEPTVDIDTIDWRSTLDPIGSPVDTDPAAEGVRSANGMRRVIDSILPTMARNIGHAMYNAQDGLDSERVSPRGGWALADADCNYNNRPADYYRDVITVEVPSVDEDENPITVKTRAWRWRPMLKGTTGRWDSAATADCSVEFFNIRIRRIRKILFSDLDISPLRDRTTKVVRYFNNSSSEIPIRRETETEEETEKTDVDEKEISAEFKESARISGSYLSVSAEVSTELTQMIKSNSSKTLRSRVSTRELTGKDYTIKPYSSWELKYESGVADISQDVTVLGQLEAGCIIRDGQHAYVFQRLEAMRDAFAGLSQADHNLAKWHNDPRHALGEARIDAEFAVPDAEIRITLSDSASAVENAKINERFLTDAERKSRPSGVNPDAGSEDHDEWDIDI